MAISDVTSSSNTLAQNNISQIANANYQNQVRQSTIQQDQNPQQGQNSSTVVTLSQNAQNLYQQAQTQAQEALQLQGVQNQNQQNSISAVGNSGNLDVGASNNGIGISGIQFIPGESRGGNVNTFA